MSNSHRQIIDDLVRADLIADYNDLSQVASALEKGESRDEILYSATLEKWPKAFDFLRRRL